MKKLFTKIAIVGSGAIMFAGVALANGGALTAGSVGNSDTGYNSYNKAELEVNNDTSVRNDNNYRILNDINAWLETGDNELKGNTHGGFFWNSNSHSWGTGEINTGDANADISVKNSGNHNTTDVLGSGFNSELPSVYNSMTGALSENRAEAEVSNDTHVTNTNTACVTNDINVKASTGDNEANFNTGDASITTGDASVSVSVDNNLNSNTTTVK